MKRKIFAIMLAAIALVAFLIVPIGAIVEDGTEQQLEDDSLLDKYPYLNLLPVTWQNIAGEHNGATITVAEDGTINVRGTINAPGENLIEPGSMLINYYDILLYHGEGIEVPEVCTFASNDTSGRSYVYISLEEGGRINVKSNESVTFETNGLKIKKIILRLRFDGLPVDTTIQPTLNAGYESYPFLPYSLFEDLNKAGYDEGYASGYQNGYDIAWSGGYNSGYSTGYTFGESDGYSQGSADGFSQGKAEGYEEGKAYGVNIGIKQGEQSTVTRDFKTIVNDIATAPYTFLSTMFDFDIFGIDIAGAVFTLFTVIVIGFVIGFFVKLIL